MISHSKNVTGVTGVTGLAVEPAISQIDFETSSVTGDLSVTPVTQDTGEQSNISVTGKSPVTPVTNLEWQRWLSERPLPTDDPRPDLKADSALWAALLPLAHGHGPWELFGALNGLRCMGAGLVERRSRVELWHSKMDKAEYDADREKYLMPYAAELVKVLAEVRA